MPLYAFEYDHEGRTYCLTIQADSELDAISRIDAMSQSELVGEVIHAEETQSAGVQ